MGRVFEIGEQFRAGLGPALQFERGDGLAVGEQVAGRGGGFPGGEGGVDDGQGGFEGPAADKGQGMQGQVGGEGGGGLRVLPEVLAQAGKAGRGLVELAGVEGGAGGGEAGQEGAAGGRGGGIGVPGRACRGAACALRRVSLATVAAARARHAAGRGEPVAPAWLPSPRGCLCLLARACRGKWIAGFRPNPPESTNVNKNFHTAMPRETPVRAVLTVVESLSDRHYRAVLPNGKPVVAHLRKSAPEAWRHCGPGTRLIGELSPYDFEHAPGWRNGCRRNRFPGTAAK